MNPKRLRRPLAALVLGGTAAFLGAVSTAHAFTNPPIQMAQGIEYMCGGAARDEAAFMEMVSPRWAATIELGISDGKGALQPGFPAKASVEIRQKYTGQPVMSVESQSPYMLARLNPGAYDVNVTLGGLTLTQTMVVIAGVPARASFAWPSNFDMASVTPPQAQTLAQSSASVR
ncbi:MULTISPECIES: hypothetical protein [Variovorax]|jgi:hypothetical protein|uniref:hypothetical protein n=1 Tax=Variovorax TaxID=34072 RepID=UPI00037D0BAE|nr:hypothetical protein [Variovorax paradoxus]